VAHKRTAIREAVVTLLSGKTDAGANVFANRTQNIPANQLPAIIVFCESETAIPRGGNIANGYTRTLELRVQVLVRDTAPDSDMDDICEDIESILSANKLIGGNAVGTVYTGTEITQDDSGSKPVGTATLNFTTKYFA
jgi:hypothetical protein